MPSWYGDVPRVFHQRSASTCGILPDDEAERRPLVFSTQTSPTHTGPAEPELAINIDLSSGPRSLYRMPPDFQRPRYSEWIIKNEGRYVDWDGSDIPYMMSFGSVV